MFQVGVMQYVLAMLKIELQRIQLQKSKCCRFYHWLMPNTKNEIKFTTAHEIQKYTYRYDK